MPDDVQCAKDSREVITACCIGSFNLLLFLCDFLQHLELEVEMDTLLKMLLSFWARSQV